MELAAEPAVFFCLEDFFLPGITQRNTTRITVSHSHTEQVSREILSFAKTLGTPQGSRALLLAVHGSHSVEIWRSKGVKWLQTIRGGPFNFGRGGGEG